MAFRALSESQKSFLLDATLQYAQAMPRSAAEEALESRGLHRKDVFPFKLGVVDDPLPGHEQYAGMLAIPYIRFNDIDEASVASIRFRCMKDHDHGHHGKYNTVAGDRPRLYNTRALQTPSDVVAITEGELDAITLHARCDVPAVGLPGVGSWADHFALPFAGYETVWIFGDGDKPGETFAKKLADALPNGKVIQLPTGEDVNSLVAVNGPEAILERINA